MKRFASIVAVLFLVNLMVAALGPHCAGLTAAHAATADHEHGGHDGRHKAPPAGEVCSQMQLVAVLSAVAMPKPVKVETVAVLVDVPPVPAGGSPSPVEHWAIPPPPLILGGFAATHARTGRLLI